MPMVAEQGPESSFRRLVMGALVALWLGLTLLAVGLVFGFSSRGMDIGVSVLEGPNGSSILVKNVSATATATLALEGASPTARSVSTLASATPLAATPVPTITAAHASGPPTRIVIPRIGLDASVVPVGWHEEVVDGVRLAVWDVADYAAGWHKTSGVPGAGTNIVISGHHNIRGSVFRDLATLQAGDVVTLYVGEQAFQYVVHSVMILPEKGMPLEVRQQNARWIEPTEREQLTLVTCWPHDNNTHRVIVVAYPQG